MAGTSPAMTEKQNTSSAHTQRFKSPGISLLKQNTRANAVPNYRTKLTSHAGEKGRR
jgi:hypothetical protein